MDRLGFNSTAAINEDRLIRQQLSNDLANVTTTGFKRTFDSHAYTPPTKCALSLAH